MQTKNLDTAVRELRSQQDRLLQIKQHDAERYVYAPPAFRIRVLGIGFP